ncbi:MAG: efflux RND transporter periplasmic adaptor subunit [Verrucomicrobiota bacterium]
MKKNTIALILPALAWLTLAGWFSGCSGDQNAAQSAPPRMVRSVTVTQDADTFQRTFSGKIHSTQETNLSFKVSGTIARVNVQIGDSFKKGDILAELDPAIYKLAAKQAEATLAEAKANARNATSNLERIKKLYADGNSSLNELENAQAEADSTIANVEASTQALELAELDVSYTKLVAEDNCGVASVNAEIGENVQMGEVLIQANCGDTLEAQIDIPESQISNISQGMAATVRVDARGNETFTAMINEVGVSAVDGSTTFPVSALITDPRTSELQAGLSADVIIRIKRAQSSITVPSSALSEDADGRFVYVIQSQSDDLATVSRQSVEVGSFSEEEGFQILSGLEPGTRIVTAGISFLREGMEVKF